MGLHRSVGTWQERKDQRLSSSRGPHSRSQCCNHVSYPSIPATILCLITIAHTKFLPCPALTQVAMIAVLRTPPAPVLILSWSVVVVVGVVYCTDAGPDLCTLCLVVTNSNLWWSCFSSQPLAQTPLATAVVSPIATCTGGIFLPPMDWRRYQTYTRATCTVWWWFFGGSGGICMLMWQWWL